MTTVLVTGGAGYVGSHTCQALARAGYEPVTYDNLSRGHAEAVKWGPLEVGELADGARLRAVLRQYAPAGVLHFAAFAYVGESAEQPALYYRNNVVGSLTLLEAMVACGVPRIVFSSTCATYGVPEHMPIREDHPQAPINPYGASKLMVERILRDFEAAYRMDWMALRYFNATGADPDGEIGESHDPEPHLIPNVLAAAGAAGKPVTIFGDDYPTPDGTCVRDYVHVADLAEAHVNALGWLSERGESMALNLGTGRGHSVLEVVEAARAVTGVPIEVTIGPRRPGDPPELVSDPALAKRVLGWTPRYPELAVQLSHGWRWHQRTYGPA